MTSGSGYLNEGPGSGNICGVHSDVPNCNRSDAIRIKMSGDVSTSERQFNGTPHSIPDSILHRRVAEEVPTSYCYPGADRLGEDTLRREERSARKESEMNYLAAVRRRNNDARREQKLKYSVSPSSSSPSSSVPSFYPSPLPSSLPTSFPPCMADSSLLYGPDIYDFLELLHEVNLAHSSRFRNFSIGCVRRHM